MEVIELNGTIDKIFDTETFASGFQKRTLILKTNGNYPQFLPIEFTKDKIDVLNSYSVNDDVKIAINLNCKPWENKQGEVKYFPSISGWKIEKTTQSAQTQKETPKVDNPFADDEENLDLPF